MLRPLEAGRTAAERSLLLTSGLRKPAALAMSWPLAAEAGVGHPDMPQRTMLLAVEEGQYATGGINGSGHAWRPSHFLTGLLMNLVISNSKYIWLGFAVLFLLLAAWHALKARHAIPHCVKPTGEKAINGLSTGIVETVAALNS